MAAGTIDVPVDCPHCAGRPFHVKVDVQIRHAGTDRAELIIDHDHLAMAVRTHARQHA